MLGLSRIVLISISILIGWSGAVECCLAQESNLGLPSGAYQNLKTVERVFMMGGDSVEKRFGPAGFIESGNSFPPKMIELTYREVMQRAASRNFDIALQNEVVNEASIAIKEKSSYFYPNISLRPTFVRKDTYERFDSITRPRVQSPEFDPFQQIYFDQIQAGKVLNGIDILSECSVLVDGTLVYNGFAYAQPKCLPIPTTAIEFASYADARPYESFNLVSQVGQLMRFGGYASFSLRTGYERKSIQYQQVSGTDSFFNEQSRAYVTSLTFGFSTPLPFGKNFGAYGNGGAVAIKLAEANSERANLTRSSVINNTLLAADNAFWDLVASHLGLKITEEQKQLVARLRAKALTQYELGLITEYSLNQIDLQLSSLRGREALERNSFKIASERLSVLINGDVNEILFPVNYQDQFEIVYAFEAETALRNAMNQNIDIRQNLALVELSQISLAFQTNQQKPDLSLNLGLSIGQSGQYIGYNSYDASFRNLLNWDTRNITAGISLRIPIGNRAAKSALSQSRIGVMQARDQLTQVKTTVVQKLTTTIDQLRNAIRKLEFLRSNQAVLEDSLEAANRRYQSQLVSEFELLEVQKDLLNLKRNRLEIMVNLRKNYSLFLALQNKINRSDFQLN